MKTTNQIIEEGIVQAKTIGINFDYDDGTSTEWLRLYSERLVDSVRRCGKEIPAGSMKIKTSLHNHPFDHERFDCDSKWLPTAITAMVGVSVCCVILLVATVIAVL